MLKWAHPPLIIFFFACLFFFSFFYELACQNIDEKTWQTQSNTLNHILLQPCVLSYILFIQKSSSLFHTEQSCDRLKFETSAAQRGGKKMLKKKKKNAFRFRFSNLSQALRQNFFSLALSVFRGGMSQYWRSFKFLFTKNISALFHS